VKRAAPIVAPRKANPAPTVEELDGKTRRALIEAAKLLNKYGGKVEPGQYWFTAGDKDPKATP
jgi:hypothetical protein